jgi:hypothetical protein
VKQQQRDGEWVGGLVSMPAFVMGEGEPYRPELLVWIDSGGAVLGTTLGKPGELLGQACESLRNTIRRPMVGQPRAPARLRVASAQLADALRTGHPGLEVLCAVTPEIDMVLAAMREGMSDGADTEPSYLSLAIGPDAVASFFRAAAGLFRAAPWKVVPDDTSIISVTIEQLGMRDAAMSVIGQLGRSLGLVLFSGFDDFEAYLGAAEANQRGQRAVIPPHLALNFERGADLSAVSRRQVAERRWVVAAANAYPWPVAVDGDMVARPPTPNELVGLEAIALALPDALADRASLLAAWNGGKPVAHVRTVPTHAGEVEVALRVPTPWRRRKRWRGQGQLPARHGSDASEAGDATAASTWESGHVAMRRSRRGSAKGTGAQ